MTAEELTKEALELSLEERTQMASKLLQSIDEPTPDEVQKRWVDVALSRYQDLKSGRGQGVTLEEVREDLRSRLD